MVAAAGSIDRFVRRGRGYDTLMANLVNKQLRRAEAGAPATPPLKIATYNDYADAQKAVDQLSDSGFPVFTASIVWTDLRHVEHVTGRRTVLSAAFNGALAGAWFGSLLGLLLTFFVETTDDTSAIGVVLAYLVLGALAGALWYAGAHALQRGKRDFQTLGRFEAEHYELWVQPETSNLAMDVLGLDTTDQPADPGFPVDRSPADRPTP